MLRRDRDLARIARHRLAALAAVAPGGPPGPGPRTGGAAAVPPTAIDRAGPRRDPAPAPAPAHRSVENPSVGWAASDVAPGWAPRRSPRTTTAVQIAAAGYTAAHGDPVTRAPAPRRRVRWAVSWRLAAAAGAVVLLVAGAVALRATAVAPGPALVLPTPAPVLEGAGGGAAPPGADDGASPTGGADVVVDVVGAVAAPGVVRLAQGSRVVDAIAAAGGATADAQVSALNLARLLVDGEQIAVPTPGAPPADSGAAGPAAGDDLVDLNTADAAALDALPGIGPVLADRIVSHREDGPFTTVDELADVAGIGPTLLERLRDLVRV